MMRTFLLLLITAALSATAIAQESGAGNVQRNVKGQTLYSSARPALRIKFDKKLKYVGTQSFILYDVANAEQHFFVDADKAGNIKRVYWVQFEGYLPNNTHTYNYRVNKTATINGLEFIADSAARNIEAAKAQQRPNSDGARARDLLEKKGFRFASGEAFWQRLVHMVDSSKRDELMIIYMEDLGSTGLTSADLSGNGKAAAQWEGLSKELLKRAISGIEITRN
jgi:hypothetical protein